MKTSTKIIIGLLILIAGIGWFAYSLYQKAELKVSKSPIEKVAKEQIQTEAAEIKKEVDKNGLQHTVYKMVKEIDQSAVDAVKADLLDTAEALGIARNKLKQVLVINTSLVITNQKLEKKVSELATTYIHADDHFRLLVNVPKDSLQSATFNAGYDADLIAIQHNKRKWLLWNDPLIDVYSNDLRFTNKGLRSFRIKPKEPVLAFKIEGRADYNKIAGPSAGPGAIIRVGKFAVGGSYQYYPDFKKWSPGYSATFRIAGSN